VQSQNRIKGDSTLFLSLAHTVVYMKEAALGDKNCKQIHG